MKSIKWLRVGMLKWLSVGMLLVGVLAMPSAAGATDVYLNGVKVNGMTGQEFKGAGVKFDAKGNIYITAPGVSVSVSGRDGVTNNVANTGSGRVTKSYFLISEKNNPGATQYAIDVHINGQFVARVKSSDGQTVLDVTKHLSKGANKVTFTAIKDIAGGRKSFAATDKFSLFIGQGKRASGNLMLDKTLVKYTRTAADVANNSFEHTIQID